LIFFGKNVIIEKTLGEFDMKKIISLLICAVCFICVGTFLGCQDQNQEQNKDQQENQDQQDKQDKQDDRDQQNKDQQGDGKQEPEPQNNQPKQEPQNSPKGNAPQPRMSQQEAEQLLQAIQGEEDKTRDKMDRQRGVAVGRSGKNW
jgi:flagellum-specific peptidoglycan hydrolase FlgJ